jgi:hypothetical protein
MVKGVKPFFVGWLIGVWSTANCRLSSQLPSAVRHPPSKQTGPANSRRARQS